MSSPIIFPPQKTEESQFVNRNVSRWHQYASPQANTSEAYWHKIASWTHTDRFNTYGAHFKVMSRDANGTIVVHNHWSNGSIDPARLSCSIVGYFDHSFEARLIDAGSRTIGENIAKDFELWIKNGPYSSDGFVSVEQFGGWNLDEVINIRHDYTNTARTSVPTGAIKIINEKNGANSFLQKNKKTITTINGYASHEEPLSLSVSMTGLVEVNGIINNLNLDGSPATTLADLTFATLPFESKLPKKLRKTIAMGNTGTVNIYCNNGVNLMFASPITDKAYIDFQYQL